MQETSEFMNQRGGYDTAYLEHLICCGRAVGVSRKQLMDTLERSGIVVLTIAVTFQCEIQTNKMRLH